MATVRKVLRSNSGRQARYRGLRSRRLLTALGEVEIARSRYLCPHCRQGQFPADRELDIENTDFRPACGACTLWSDSKRRLIMAASR
jgi:ribosomal protein S27AE